MQIRYRKSFYHLGASFFFIMCKFKDDLILSFSNKPILGFCEFPDLAGRPYLATASKALLPPCNH